MHLHKVTENMTTQDSLGNISSDCLTWQVTKLIEAVATAELPSGVGGTQ